MSNIITKSTGAVSDVNNSSEQAESAHKDIPDFTLEPVTNSQYDDLMDDLNSNPEFDKILAEMLPMVKILYKLHLPAVQFCQKPHSGAVSNVFSCNYQWNAGFQTFPQPVITDQNAYNYWCLKKAVSGLIGVHKVILTDAKRRPVSLFAHQ